MTTYAQIKAKCRIIGRDLRIARTAQDRSEVDVAMAAGVPVGHVVAVENGNESVPWHYVLRLAVALGCELAVCQNTASVTPITDRLALGGPLPFPTDGGA